MSKNNKRKKKSKSPSLKKMISAIKKDNLEFKKNSNFKDILTKLVKSKNEVLLILLNFYLFNK